MKSLLTAKNINFEYSKDNPILENFKFQINRGDMSGLIGPNGAGKSTALKILSGYITPSSGNVFVKDQDITKISNKDRSEVIGIVGQNIYTPLPFTVKQIVEMGRSVRISRFAPLSKNDHEIVDNAIVEMDIAQFANKQFNELSGGEKQRVKIAAALAQEPDVLLLDEPTSQLDMGHAIHLMKHLIKLNTEKKIAILIVSHDIQLMASFMRNLILIKDGKIIAKGSSKNVLKADLIENAYNCKVEITKTSTGKIRITPIT